jgi:hypothetical protein
MGEEKRKHIAFFIRLPHEKSIKCTVKKAMAYFAPPLFSTLLKLPEGLPQL